MKNILTFDIEEWFNFRGFEKRNPFGTWTHLEKRVNIGTDKILNLLEKYKTKATFFILGWIAENNPSLVEKIKKKGHEIGTHGYAHTEIFRQDMKTFENELTKSINILENITNQKIISHRASNFSIIQNTLWALEILRKNGIKYDSSIYPIKRKFYGINNSKKEIHEIIPGVIEIPLSSINFFSKEIPIAGGGYLRVYPYFLTEYFIRTLNKNNVQAVVYIHPWELDPDQPDVKIPFKEKINHYINLKSTEKKLEKLLRSFSFTSISDYFLERNMKTAAKGYN